MTLIEIADLISSPDAEYLFSGNYLNRRGIRGYYLQVKCGVHWCRISVSNVDRHSDRITVAELDEIQTASLLSIPVQSISAALKSECAERAAINTYFNSSGIEGIWSEFYYDGHWYMISVSHIHGIVPKNRSALERMADEFLRQQGQLKRSMISRFDPFRRNRN